MEVTFNKEKLRSNFLEPLKAVGEVVVNESD
jgi:hypothetical protein